jgi:hypothetical protein
MVRATLEVLRALGAHPFVVAAMGSHGGATAAGQRQLLAEYGVSEPALRVPVKADMTAVRIGTNSWGEPVWWDRNAWDADAVVTLSRVKPHTDFRGRYESGIVKMLAIGLGKREGASQHHRWGVRGLREMLPETARVILEKTRFVAGLAILENAREETARLQVVGRDAVLDEEPRLLAEARGLMGRLPFAQLDLLVIGELGKNYSGAGIDPNVVGRLLMEGQPEPELPRITRICVLDLSPESHGNATGVGIADLTTERLLAHIDQGPFRMNNLTRLLPFLSPSPRMTISPFIPPGASHEHDAHSLLVHQVQHAGAGRRRQPAAADRGRSRVVSSERRSPGRNDHAAGPGQIRLHRGASQEPGPQRPGRVPQAGRAGPRAAR